VGTIKGAHLRSQVLKPHGHLMRQTILSIVAFFAPVFAVLYWLTIPSGTWLPVLWGQLVVVLLVSIGFVGYFRTRIWVDETGISERGFLGRLNNFPVDQVESIVMLELYQTGALDTQPQLFVTGADGRLLVRMRGQFYSRGAMDTVMDELAVPIVHVPDPMTLAELNRLRPGLLYWFERRITGRASGASEPDAGLG
jgi:hypothetical protein